MDCVLRSQYIGGYGLGEKYIVRFMCKVCNMILLKALAAQLNHRKEILKEFS